jgi:hypothetical protein
MPAKSTLRGVPLAPGPAGVDEPARPGGPVEPFAPTEVLGKPEIEQPAALSPQLFISTKLARPVGTGADAPVDPSGERSASDGAPGRARHRRWMLLLGAAGLLAVGLYAGRGLLYRGAAPGSASPSPAAGRPAAPSRAAGPATPVREAEPAAPSRANEPPVRPTEPAARSIRAAHGTAPSVVPAKATEHAANAQALHVQPPVPRQKNAAIRKKQSTPSTRSPKMGLDKNGIGIPSN